MDSDHMFSHLQKRILLFLISWGVSLGTEAKVLCIASDHIAVESMAGSCSGVEGFSKETAETDLSTKACLDIVLFDLLFFKEKSSKPGIIKFQKYRDIAYAFSEISKKYEPRFYPYFLSQHSEFIFRSVALLSIKSIVLRI